MYSFLSSASFSEIDNVVGRSEGRWASDRCNNSDSIGQTVFDEVGFERPLSPEPVIQSIEMLCRDGYKKTAGWSCSGFVDTLI